MPSAGGRGRRRGKTRGGLGPAIPVPLPALLLRLLLLPLLALVRGDVLEGDGALDVLSGEDGLLGPVHEDTDVAGAVGRHIGRYSVGVGRDAGGL